MIEAIIDWLMEGVKSLRNRKGFKMKVDPIKNNYRYIPEYDRRYVIQNQRRS